MTRAELDAALLAAHEAGDRRALIGLYAAAADGVAEDAARFYLTHAYVFALESGAAEAAALRARLVRLGAETEDRAAMPAPAAAAHRPPRMART